MKTFYILDKLILQIFKEIILWLNINQLIHILTKTLPIMTILLDQIEDALNLTDALYHKWRHEKPETRSKTLHQVADGLREHKKKWPKS